MMAESQDRGFAFLDVPRLELDQLLGQLVERAQEVMANQGRMRGLLRAHQAVASDLDLPVVLRRITEAARELVGARYAALGVIGSDGHLTEFIHSGMSADTAAVIGHLPQGKGLLGALIDTPEPIRLARISDDDRSSGFPAGHPPMNSFLGVPIRIRDEVFGNLYLTESDHGEFTAEDQELVLALAASAAVAIDNARSYAVARVRGEWLRAAAAVSHAVLGCPDRTAADEPGGEGRTEDRLPLIADLCCRTADADAVTIWLPSGDGRLRAGATAGTGPLSDPELPGDTPMFRDALTTGTPTRIAARDESGPHPAAGIDAGPMMVLPLRGTGAGWGVATVVRRRGRRAFTAEDLDMAARFADQATVALELAEARAEQERSVLLDERDRIAADLHDRIIRRLFATGLSLHGAIAGVPWNNVRQRVLEAVGELDGVIGELRTTVFALEHPSGTGPSGLRAHVLDVATDLTPTLGFEPVVRFTGPVETIADPDLGSELLAVAREGLMRVARRGATRAELDLSASGGRVVLEIHDDGDDPPAVIAGGLDAARRRAERRGGAMTIRAREPRGTVVAWAVPSP